MPLNFSSKYWLFCCCFLFTLTLIEFIDFYGVLIMSTWCTCDHWTLYYNFANYQHKSILTLDISSIERVQISRGENLFFEFHTWESVKIFTIRNTRYTRKTIILLFKIVVRTPILFYKDSSSNMCTKKYPTSSRIQTWMMTSILKYKFRLQPSLSQGYKLEWGI